MTYESDRISYQSSEQAARAFHKTITRQHYQIQALKAELEMLESNIQDSERLDYLDHLNSRQNDYYRSMYGWEININHNRVALHDIGPKGVSVREAIDRHQETHKKQEVEGERQ